MARVYHMAWVPARRGWMKQYNGHKYAVSCRQLSEQLGIPVPESKEGSYQAANQWWARKKQELDEASRPQVRPLLPMEDMVTALLGYQGPLTEQDANTLNMLSACGEAGLNQQPEVHVRINEEGEAVDCWPASLGPNPTPEDRIRLAVNTIGARILRQMLQGQPFPEESVNLLSPARMNQLQDSLAGVRGEASAPQEKTVRFHADAWLQSIKTQANLKGCKDAHYHNSKIGIEHFVRFLGEGADVGSINADKLRGFYDYCREQAVIRLRAEEAGTPRIKGKLPGWSPRSAEGIFNFARKWLRWLEEQDIITPLKNISSRVSFGVSAQQVPTWTVEEFRFVIGQVQGKLKLALLLMANCGMTQQDISDLQDTEVNWQLGTITRKRSKAKNYKNAPEVCYPLWPEPFRLLKEHRSGGPRVLLTEKGTPLIRKEWVNGRLTQKDALRTDWDYWQKKLDFHKPLKQLRKTSATLLEGHEVYGRFVGLFLAHTPHSIAEKHYVRPSQAVFSDAVKWLGQVLGQVE